MAAVLVRYQVFRLYRLHLRVNQLLEDTALARDRSRELIIAIEHHRVAPLRPDGADDVRDVAFPDIDERAEDSAEA